MKTSQKHQIRSWSIEEAKCTRWRNSLYILGVYIWCAFILLPVSLSTAIKSAYLHWALVSHWSVTSHGLQTKTKNIQDEILISASKSLHHSTVPTQFPPYRKSPPATVISVPERGTLGRQSVWSQHRHPEEWPSQQLICSSSAWGWKQRTISLLGSPFTREVKMISCWLCNSGSQ